MNNQQYLLFDGQSLERDEFSFLYKFHSQSETDIFTLYNQKLVLNYVGHIEIVVDKIKYELFCFPKEFDINGVEKSINLNKLPEHLKNEINESFKMVIKSIEKTQKSMSEFSETNEKFFYVSNLYFLNEIIKHYNQYGLLLEVEKDYKPSQNGNIKWNKTISKIIPKLNNGNMIYDKFIVEKKNQETSMLTKIIAKVIFEGTTRYSFYMDIIDTGVDYSDINGWSVNLLIEQLYDMKNRTFKDYMHHVINCLIKYLQNESVKSTNGILLGTNKYNFVWEHVVAHGLGNDFVYSEEHFVGKHIDYNKRENKKNIIIDHINEKEKIIADSKYYNDSEQLDIDFKQLYYNYFLVFKTQNKEKTYEDILNEYSKWINVLIKPTKGEPEFSYIEFNDHMKLYSQKINTRLAIKHYVNDNYETEIGFETKESLKIIDIINKLKER